MKGHKFLLLEIETITALSRRNFRAPPPRPRKEDLIQNTDLGKRTSGEQTPYYNFLVLL